MSTTSRTPVIVLTGFLGSGKTTILSHLLGQPVLHDTAIVINEFGEIGLDHALIAHSDEQIVALNSGCLCCTVRSDLVRTLARLRQQRDSGALPPFARLVIETTGLADPGPVLQSVLSAPLHYDYTLGLVLTAVDALNGPITLDRHIEAVKQASVADTLLLTKCDLITTAARTALVSRLAALNPGAALIEVDHGRLDPAVLTATDPFDPESKSDQVRNWLGTLERSEPPGHDHSSYSHHDHNRHDAQIQAHGFTLERPLSAASLAAFLDALQQLRGPDLLRLKGLVCLTEQPDYPVVIHMAQHVLHPLGHLERWPDNDQRSRLVIITRSVSREWLERLLNVVDAR